MLRRVLDQVKHLTKRVEIMAESLTAALKVANGEDGVQSTDGEPAAKKIKIQDPPAMCGRTDRKRKVALLLVYCGAGYFGIQRQNTGHRTIEEDLIKALVKTELIPPEHAESPQKMSFQRASRTDKGVSAAGNVISLKMLLNKDDVLHELNECLPSKIRVLAYKRTTKTFDGQHNCSYRTYTYMLPTYAFAPFEKFITEEYRTSEEILKDVAEVLQKFVGTHNFHNYTSGVKASEPCAHRYILTFECSEPFIRENMEFVTLTVTGQSFMLHHIRKMIGLTIAIVKGYCGKNVIEKSWKPDRIDVPKAPAVGLFLEKLHYNAYNNKFGSDGIHDPISWEEHQDKIDHFKEEHILKHIVQSEKEDKSLFRWLATLQCHHFDVQLDEGQKEWWSSKRLIANMSPKKETADGSVKSDTPDERGDNSSKDENKQEGSVTNVISEEGVDIDKKKVDTSSNVASEISENIIENSADVLLNVEDTQKESSNSEKLSSIS